MKFLSNNFAISVTDPSQCPHCHNGIEPRHISESTEKEINYSIWKCTFRECGKQFIAVHQDIGQRQATFLGFLDGQPTGPYWPDTIKKLKSKFIETYNQALKAEYSSLDEIAGMGF